MTIQTLTIEVLEAEKVITQKRATLRLAQLDEQISKLQETVNN